MRLLAITLIAASTACLTMAADSPLAGRWRLNAAKSEGPAPPCLKDGVLEIPAEIYTGSSTPKRVPAAGKCARVYLFKASPDGSTLTMTPAHGNPKEKAVFDRQ